MDGSAFFTLKVVNDINHRGAIVFLPQILDGEFGGLLTTDYVLDELTTLTMIRVSHAAALRLYESIVGSSSIDVVPVTPELREKAFEIFSSHPDRRYSFTDCVSFALMESLGIDDAFTFDRHFQQAGFTAHP